MIACDAGIASTTDNSYTYTKDVTGPVITYSPGTVQEANICTGTLTSVSDAGIGGTVQYSQDNSTFYTWSSSVSIGN